MSNSDQESIFETIDKFSDLPKPFGQLYEVGAKEIDGSVTLIIPCIFAEWTPLFEHIPDRLD